jgi:lysophospholipase L1-like esterase
MKKTCYNAGLAGLISLLVLSQAWAEEKSPSMKWEKDIQKFEAADKTNPPPEGAVLFIGSSTIRMWKTLKEDFPEHKVINRGFGGSQIADSVYYADRIVIPYKPKMILLYAGGNDINAGKTPEAVFEDFKAFVVKVREKLPSVRIAYMSSGPSIARWAQADKQRKLNQLIKEHIEKDGSMDFIEAFDHFLGPDGKPRPDLFVADKLHNNAAGYKIRADLVRPYLEKFRNKPDAQHVDWRKMMTIAERKRDAQGGLLPLQSYEETIRRGMDFLLKDHLTWFKGAEETLLDEKGRTQMPWVYYSKLQQNGAPFSRSVDRFVSYPAFHHALMIRTFMGYWCYTGNKQALTEAFTLADWEIAHSTPADWPYGNLPWSTFQEKKPGGFRDKTGLMPDKAAIMGLAYLQLYEAIDEKRFLQAAEAIAKTLAARQRPDGTWPFRVDPKTEAVIEEYTSSVIYAVRLFEALDKLNKNDRYRVNRDKTWNWLVNGPIKTKEFRGFYEDIPASKDGRTNYDCLDTIRYLLANRTDTNGYLEMAKDLNAWVEKTFMDKIKGFEPAEGIREQLQCNVVMGIHSLNWASMLLDLSKATGDEKLRQRAIQTANYITYYLQPDNRIVVGFQYNQWWYSCHAGMVLYLLDFAKVSSSSSKTVGE